MIHELSKRISCSKQELQLFSLIETRNYIRFSELFSAGVLVSFLCFEPSFYFLLMRLVCAQQLRSVQCVLSSSMVLPNCFVLPSNLVGLAIQFSFKLAFCNACAIQV